MLDIIQEELVNFLNKKYCQMEDILWEHDITKEEFLKCEKIMAEIARWWKLDTEYYPFKINN